MVISSPFCSFSLSSLLPLLTLISNIPFPHTLQPPLPLSHPPHSGALILSFSHSLTSSLPHSQPFPALTPPFTTLPHPHSPIHNPSPPSLPHFYSPSITHTPFSPSHFHPLLSFSFLLSLPSLPHLQLLTHKWTPIHIIPNGITAPSFKSQRVVLMKDHFPPPHAESPRDQQTHPCV